MTRRGEVYYVDWSSGRGSERSGVRPALIIQNDVGNQASPTTIVAAISTRKRNPYPFQVTVSPGESGLPRSSVVKCEQIQTIDQGRLGDLVGRLTEDKMQEVDVALLHSLGLS